MASTITILKAKNTIYKTDWSRKNTFGQIDIEITQSVTKAYHAMTLCDLPTSMKASTARSMSSIECEAEIWTRILAFTLGTTGKLNPTT